MLARVDRFPCPNPEVKRLLLLADELAQRATDQARAERAGLPPLPGSPSPSQLLEQSEELRFQAYLASIAARATVLRAENRSKAEFFAPPRRPIQPLGPRVLGVPDPMSHLEWRHLVVPLWPSVWALMLVLTKQPGRTVPLATLLERLEARKALRRRAKSPSAARLAARIRDNFYSALEPHGVSYEEVKSLIACEHGLGLRLNLERHELVRVNVLDEQTLSSLRARPAPAPPPRRGFQGRRSA